MAMSTDTDISQADLPASTPQRDSPDRGVDVSQIFRDERLDAGRDRGEDFSARSAADHLIEKRKSNQANRDYHEADDVIDPISIVDADGTRTDRHASATQGDARRYAEEITNYREARNKIAEDYLTQTYGEAEGAADPAATPAYEQPSEQDLIADQVRQAEARVEAARNAEQQRAATEAAVWQRVNAQHTEALAGVHMQQLKDAWAREFGDVHTDADLANLARTNPARAARAQQLAAEFSTAAQTVQARYNQEQQQVQAAHQQQQQQHAWVNYCQAHDDAFSRAHPELADPKVSYETQKEAIAYLQERGMSEDQIKQAWASDPTFRSAAAQNVLYDAVQYRLASRRAKEISSKQRLPPVSTVRPGVARDKAWVDHEQLSALGQRLGATGSVRDAAALLRARRAASR
jgi:hypothetical protein